jgi:hypothetical protein
MHGAGAGSNPASHTNQWHVSIAGPIRRPVTAEIMGSNPIRVATLKREKEHGQENSCLECTAWSGARI